MTQLEIKQERQNCRKFPWKKGNLISQNVGRIKSIWKSVLSLVNLVSTEQAYVAEFNNSTGLP